jgi:uncharacterized protein (TIGR00106 family)
MVFCELTIYPLGQSVSVGPFVARCVDIIDGSGLDYRCHAMGTDIEGEIEDVFDVVQQCFAALAEDCERIEANIKIDYRKGYKGHLDSKVASVEKRLGHAVKK